MKYANLLKIMPLEGKFAELIALAHFVQDGFPLDFTSGARQGSFRVTGTLNQFGDSFNGSNFDLNSDSFFFVPLSRVYKYVDACCLVKNKTKKGTMYYECALLCWAPS